MIINFPDKLKSNIEGYQFLSNIYHQASIAKGNVIYFNLENLTFIEANLCAVIGTLVEMIERIKKTVLFSNISKRVEEILRKNDFLINFGFDPLDDRYNTTVRYKRFNPKLNAHDQLFHSYLQDELLGKKDFPSHSQQLGKKLRQSIFELYENARTHGSCNYIHACGQYFPQTDNKGLNMTIVDTGINFEDNVSKFLNVEMGSVQALEWAIQHGNTTKSGPSPGGLGLAFIMEFIKKNGGEIQIVSSDGYLQLANNEIFSTKLNSKFYGTIANLKFNLNDTSHYYLLSELDNENVIF